MTVFTHPLTAFLLYVLLAAALVFIGRLLAGRAPTNQPIENETYASGEAPQEGYIGAPGYRAFAQIALFFAVLHLGVLILATGTPGITTGLYLAALALILLSLLAGGGRDDDDHT